MKILKRMGALFACLMIVMSCMVPAAFADETNTITSDINKVGATMSDESGKMELKLEGISEGANQVSVWEKLFTEYRGVIVGISGIGAITMIVFFIINFMKLGASAGNPQARTQALIGIIWTGLAAAGLGGVTIFVGFFYNVLKGD